MVIGDLLSAANWTSRRDHVDETGDNTVRVCRSLSNFVSVQPGS